MTIGFPIEPLLSLNIVVNDRRLRHDDAILVMHRYGVAGVSWGLAVADVVHLHGRRQGAVCTRGKCAKCTGGIASPSISAAISPEDRSHIEEHCAVIGWGHPAYPAVWTGPLAPRLSFESVVSPSTHLLSDSDQNFCRRRRSSYRCCSSRIRLRMTRFARLR